MPLQVSGGKTGVPELGRAKSMHTADERGYRTW